MTMNTAIDWAIKVMAFAAYIVLTIALGLWLAIAFLFFPFISLYRWSRKKSGIPYPPPSP